jgi:tetratricopeptide (TPR) repeat protein
MPCASHHCAKRRVALRYAFHDLWRSVIAGLALSKRGSYTDAAHILGDVLTSKHLPEAAGSRWALNLSRGNDFVQFASLTDAAAEYREAIRLKPDYGEAHNNLGIVLAHQGHSAEAVVEYKKGIRLKPDWAEAHYDLGVTLAKQRQYADAAVEFKEAIRLKPDFADAHFNLGTSLDAQGRHAGPVAEDKETIRLEPDFAEAHYNLGIALAAQGQRADAAAEYREAIRLKPELAQQKSRGDRRH